MCFYLRAWNHFPASKVAIASDYIILSWSGFEPSQSHAWVIYIRADTALPDYSLSAAGAAALSRATTQSTLKCQSEIGLYIAAAQKTYLHWEDNLSETETGPSWYLRIPFWERLREWTFARAAYSTGYGFSTPVIRYSSWRCTARGYGYKFPGKRTSYKVKHLGTTDKLGAPMANNYRDYLIWWWLGTCMEQLWLVCNHLLVRCPICSHYYGIKFLSHSIIIIW